MGRQSFSPEHSHHDHHHHHHDYQSTVLQLGPDRPPWQEVSFLLGESAKKLTLTIEKFFSFGAVE